MTLAGLLGDRLADVVTALERDGVAYNMITGGSYVPAPVSTNETVKLHWHPPADWSALAEATCETCDGAGCSLDHCRDCGDEYDEPCLHHEDHPHWELGCEDEPCCLDCDGSGKARHVIEVECPTCKGRKVLPWQPGELPGGGYCSCGDGTISYTVEVELVRLLGHRDEQDIHGTDAGGYLRTALPKPSAFHHYDAGGGDWQHRGVDVIGDPSPGDFVAVIRKVDTAPAIV